MTLWHYSCACQVHPPGISARLNQLTCTNSVVRWQGTASWCSSARMALSVAFLPTMLVNHHTLSCTAHGRFDARSLCHSHVYDCMRGTATLWPPCLQHKCRVRPLWQRINSAALLRSGSSLRASDTCQRLQRWTACAQAELFAHLELQAVHDHLLHEGQLSARSYHLLW